MGEMGVSGDCVCEAGAVEEVDRLVGWVLEHVSSLEVEE